MISLLGVMYIIEYFTKFSYMCILLNILLNSVIYILLNILLTSVIWDELKKFRLDPVLHVTIFSYIVSFTIIQRKYKY